MSKVPVRRMKTLAKYGAASKAPALDRLVEPRRTATLLAIARNLQMAQPFQRRPVVRRQSLPLNQSSR
ncbi:hypothetical protein [Planotetraspora sp. GP83]|uniref:hypothetical protein n=1 Tax=Planotetraspora sp. GP83 TaxID=3156264 RepID=UPI003517C89F